MYLLHMSTWFYLFTIIAAFHRNNVCRTFEDYYIRDFSPNCWYNPDVTANATELITRYGYPVETYKTVTEDFYILTIFRIPPIHAKSKGIVFLQHPDTASATIWIDLGKQSLAFLLADVGYDVWLGNFRGSYYSPDHVYLSQERDPNRYWNFSFHELGMYDTPAMFEVTMRETGYKEKIYYVGHSVSTTSAFVYASLLPVIAAKYVKLFICWAPMAFVKNLWSPIKVFAPYADLIKSAAELAHIGGVTYNSTTHKSIEYFCLDIPWNAEICANIVQFYMGPDHKHFSPERLPIMISQNIAGSSLKTDVHYAQIYNAQGTFQWYDYGLERNEYYYRSKRPPVYPIEAINIPMYLIYGGSDSLAVEKDVLHLYSKLRDTIKYGILKVAPYNHVDFHYAKGVENAVYKPTLEVIERVRAEEIGNTK